MTDKQIQTLFAKLDKTNTGFINVEDYRLALKGYATNEAIRDQISQMDEDLDGQVSLEEFRVSMNKAMVPEPTFVFPESVSDIDWFEVFVHYDKDGSGKLSAQELRFMLQDMGRDLEREEVIQIFNDIDRDFDGVISYSEFIQRYGKPSTRGSIDITI